MKKYYPEKIEKDFLYPNNDQYSRDVRIVHSFNDNNVTGAMVASSISLLSQPLVRISFQPRIFRNNSKFYVHNINNTGTIINASIVFWTFHVLIPGEEYVNNWRMVGKQQRNTDNFDYRTWFFYTTNTYSAQQIIELRPEDFGLAVMPSGEYKFEIRYYGYNNVFQLCQTFDLDIPIPVNINWELNEGDTPEEFVDANINIYANEVLQVGSLVNDSGTIGVFIGDVIRIEYYYLASAGISPLMENPAIELLINMGLIASQPIIVGENATYNYTFTINEETDVLVRGVGSLIPTPTPTETPTPTPTETPTPTPTPTETPPLENSLFISVHTTTCSDFCGGDNFLINTSSLSTNDFENTIIGDTIEGATIAGFYAYAASSTDTNTGPFRIAETDANGLISGLFICDGGVCTPL